MGSAPLVLLAAALAGMTTLAAETLWIRALGRSVGTTPEALASVAGLTLAGLGLGAWWAAARAGRDERPARRGTWCLLTAGVLVGLSPTYIDLLPSLHVGVLDGVGADGGGSALWVPVLALPLVLPAALLLGALFPYLVRARVAALDHAGGRTGVIYALNTAGAVAGVIGALLLLPEIGETHTLRVAGGAGLLGAFLLLLAERPLPHGDGPPAKAEVGRSVESKGIALTLAASGAAALIAQMAWFRMLEPLAGAHAWGIALLIGPVLAALALGAAVGGWLADRARRADLLLAATLVLAGVCALLSLLWAGGLPLRLVQAAMADPSARLAPLVRGFLFTCGPASFAFGAALPLGVRIRADWTGTSAASAGRLYAFNSLGALTGSLLAGFLLLPRLGAERTLLVAGALAVAIGTALRLRTPGRARTAAAAVHLLPLAVLLWPGLLDALLSSGPRITEIIAARKPVAAGITLEDRDDLALYATWFAGRRATILGDAAQRRVPLYEGRTGRVALIEEPDGVVGLRRGALREAVFAPDRADIPSPTETLLGLLPALLNPDAKRALVIGHGAGWTVDAALHAPSLDRLDVAEIDDAVLDAVRLYRGMPQLPVEAAENARLHFTDGRVLLRRAAARPDGERYDWIASQPSHPWSAAAGHLFTYEAFATARAALNEDGVLAQWLNLFDMSPMLLREALATFRAVFEHAWVFRMRGELILIGFRSAPRLEQVDALPYLESPRGRHHPAYRAGFRSAGDVWKHFALDTDGLDRVIGPGVEPLHDDVPRLEFALARRRLRAAPAEEADAILLPGFPPDLKAVFPDPERRERVLSQIVRGWLRTGATGEAEQWSRKIPWGVAPDAIAAQGASAFAAGDLARASALYERAVQRAPDRGDLAAAWIDVLSRRMTGPSGDPDLRGRVNKLVARHGDDARVLAAAARAARAAGDVKAARRLFDAAVRQDAVPAGTRVHLARILMSESFEAEDEKRARALLANDPRTYEDVDALDILLRLTSDAGDEKQATDIEKALRTLQHTHGLVLLRRAAGHLARHEVGDALEAIRECRTTWPWHAAPCELEGLIRLVDLAAARTQGAADGSPEAAVVALGLAVDRASDPAATHARVTRMLRWFKLKPGLVTRPAVQGAR